MMKAIFRFSVSGMKHGRLVVVPIALIGQSVKTSDPEKLPTNHSITRKTGFRQRGE